jgi:hypothetical protein
VCFSKSEPQKDGSSWIARNVEVNMLMDWNAMGLYVHYAHHW